MEKWWRRPSQSPLSGVFFQRYPGAPGNGCCAVKSQSPLSGVFFQSQQRRRCACGAAGGVSIPFKWGLLSETTSGTFTSIRGGVSIPFKWGLLSEEETRSFGLRRTWQRVSIPFKWGLLSEKCKAAARYWAGRGRLNPL